MKKILVLLIVVLVLSLSGCDILEIEIFDEPTCNQEDENCLQVGFVEVDKNEISAYVDLQDYYTKEEVDDMFDELYDDLNEWETVVVTTEDDYILFTRETWEDFIIEYSNTIHNEYQTQIDELEQRIEDLE
jgi:hypothetical protein